MSTSACIILKIRQSDKGKTIQFDKEKLPIALEEWERYGVKKGKPLEKSQPITLTKDYIGIYCHWDGDPEHLGKVLKDWYNDYDTILNLIAGGHCSGIDEKGVRHYANRAGEKWNYVKPLQGDYPSMVYGRISSKYCYLFGKNNGGWQLNDYKNKDNPTTELGEFKKY